MINTVSLTPAPADELVFVDAGWDVQQIYMPDPMLERFFRELPHRRLFGSRTAQGRVIFPPSSFCEMTYADTIECVPVGPAGTIRTFTLVQAKTPHGPPPPFIMVFVQLDGADTASPGYLRNSGLETSSKPSLVGARCHVVFKDEPVGEWADFWFELGE